MSTMKQTQMRSFLQASASNRLHTSFATVSHGVFRTNEKKIESNNVSGRPVVANTGGPLDLSPKDDTMMTQLDYVCATGESCLNSEIPLKDSLRCASCGFCMHAGCGVEIVSSGRIDAPPAFNHICNGCVIQRQLEKHVQYQDHTRVVSMRHPKVKKVTAIKWPAMDIITQKIVDEEIKNKAMKRLARTEKSKEQEELEELKAAEHEEREELEPDSTTDDKVATQSDSESSSDGDIAEIIGVKKGRVKPKPTFNEDDDDSDETMSEAPFSSPSNNDNEVKNLHKNPPKIPLPNTINTDDTEDNQIPFVTPHKKGQQKKDVIKPVVKATAKFTAVNPL